LSEDLPVEVGIIDTKEKVESFLQTIDHAITEGIVTVEKTHMRLYRDGGKKRRLKVGTLVIRTHLKIV
jgi:PII-like signaling protein